MIVRSRQGALVGLAIAAVVVLALVLLLHHGRKPSTTLFAPRFPARPRLVTNEFATYNPGAPGALQSTDWIATSGSLFAKDGGGYSGRPDSGDPDATSSNATGSSVFRLVSRQTDLGNISIRMRLRIDGLLSGAAPTNDWDGVHIFAHYQTEARLYVVSVSRRDGEVVAKKKLPGGTTNGGTYVQLGSAQSYPLSHDAWHDVELDVKDEDGGVRLTLHLDGHELLNVVDRGSGGPPITEAGRVGLRGDFCEFQFDRFSVRSD